MTSTSDDPGEQTFAAWWSDLATEHHREELLAAARAGQPIPPNVVTGLEEAGVPLIGVQTPNSDSTPAHRPEVTPEMYDVILGTDDRD